MNEKSWALLLGCVSLASIIGGIYLILQPTSTPSHQDDVGIQDAGLTSTDDGAPHGMISVPPDHQTPHRYFGAVLPDTGIRLTVCTPWPNGGTAPIGTVWYTNLMFLTPQEEAELDFKASAGPDAGLDPAVNQYIAVEIGVPPSLKLDGGIDSTMGNVLLALGFHENYFAAQSIYSRVILSPTHPSCQVYWDRFADPALRIQMCACGSGCQISTDQGLTWHAPPPGGNVLGPPYGQRVRASGAGVCLPMPCGCLAGSPCGRAQCR